ncbi:MAG: metallophosphoesterase [Patescibacteria group bacterium]
MDTLARKLAKGYWTLEDLKVRYADIRRLTDKGYRVHSYKVSGKTYYSILAESENVSLHLSGATPDAKHYKWLELSDLHAGSKQFDELGLREILGKAVKDGYKMCFIAGDLHDGTHIYPGHMVNLRFFSAEDQANLLAEILMDYPLHYYATTGNHDYSFEKEGGVNPCHLLQEKVQNFVYLPYFAADIIIGGVLRRQIHGATGRAYALSYPGQTYIRNLLDASGEHAYVKGKKYRLRFIQLGHFHSVIHYESAGIQVTQSGNFQFPNEYTVRRGLVGPQGGRFVDVVIQNGQILSYNSRFEKPTNGRGSR